METPATARSSAVMRLVISRVKLYIIEIVTNGSSRLLVDYRYTLGFFASRADSRSVTNIKFIAIMPVY